MSDQNTRPRYGQDGWLVEYGNAWHGQVEKLMSFFSESGVYIDVAEGLTVPRSELKGLLVSWGRYAPDSRIEFGRCVGDSDHFSAEWKWEGTATGSITLNGVKYVGSGHRFDVDGVAFCKLDSSGDLLWHKDYWDSRPVLEQTKREDVPDLAVSSRG